MPLPQQRMALTPALVSRAYRPIPNLGPTGDLVRCDDADFARHVSDLFDARPQGDPWLFAYGSLLWNPVTTPLEQRVAVAHGWHRSFCIHLESYRGTPDRPGLMMGLERGGQCRGIAFRLPVSDLRAQLDRLVRREMPVKPVSGALTNVPRWIEVRTVGGPLQALAFVVDPKGTLYAGRRGPEETADILAGACGYGGSCAEYLHNTVAHLEELGIRDRNLWRLQALVARRLSAAEPGAEAVSR
jgi:cation transport protein ChaC